MASKMLDNGAGVEDWQQIKEEITCSICGDLFTDPKTIPCLHTFCKRCIERSIESNKKMAVIVCCPLCRVPLPRDEMASIPTNFTINRLIEIFGKRQKAEASVEMKCASCEENFAAITWCIQCEDPLCHNCNEIHKKIKMSRSHKTIPIKQYFQSSKEALATLEKTELCKFHQSQPLDLYCKTCNSLICRECALKDHPCGHRDHHFLFVNEVIDQERKKIKQISFPLKQLLEHVRNGVNKIEHSEKQIDIESEANIEKIRATFGKMYRLLKKQEEETVDKVNAIKTSLKKRLSVQKNNGKLMESQLMSCNEFCEKIVTDNRTRQLLTYSKWIEIRMDELTKQVELTSLDPECKPNDMIVNCRKPAEFLNDSVCDVSCVPHLPDCTVSGPAVISNPVKVTVMLKDIFGSPVLNQSKDLEIRCNKKRDFFQNIHIVEKSRGQYNIWYSPNRKEDHSILVYWRGIPLNCEEIKVLRNLRDYSTIKEEVKIIDKYGPTNKSLTHPCQLAKGLNNELIVRDKSTNQLVVFDKHLNYSHVIGGAGKGSGKFQNITGIAVDKRECVCIYVADCNLNCIQKFKLNGEFISQFGCEGSANGQFKHPRGLFMSKLGLLFVCDHSNHRIQVFYNDEFYFSFGQKGKNPGAFNNPNDLVLNSNEDQLFVTDHHNSRVQVFTPNGQFLKMFGNFADAPFKLQHPVGIHYTPDGRLLISCCSNNCVLVFEEDGKFISAIEGTYQGKERFINPCGVVMMENGQIVITGGYNSNRLVVF